MLTTSGRYHSNYPMITTYWDRLPPVKLNDSIVFTCKKKSINGKISSIGNEMIEVIANGKKYLVGRRKKKWEGQLI